MPAGVALQYVEQGSRSGVPVLLLHAYLDSWRSFEQVLRHLPETVHAVALTQRGHGDSDRPADGYRPTELAADVRAFMDAADLGAAVLVGSSSACDTARRFAIDHPDRTLGLVLIGGFHTFPADAPAVREMREEIAMLTDPIDPDFVRDFVEGTAANGVPRAFLDTMVDESRKVPAHVWRYALDGLLEAAPATGTIHAPTLVIWGDQDAICPRSQQDALLAAIPSAKLRIYSGAGHLVHWEQPKRVADDITAFAIRAAA